MTAIRTVGSQPHDSGNAERPGQRGRSASTGRPSTTADANPLPLAPLVKIGPPMTLPGSVKQSSSDLLTSFLHDTDATPPQGWKNPTALYRFFDTQGDLLYLGITSRLRIRMTEHARDYSGTWWPLVASRTVEWFQTRVEAGRTERKAIVAERPPKNVLHTPRSRVPLGQHKGGPIKKPSCHRGRHLLSVIREAFADAAFTQADLRAVSGQSPSATTKNVRALVAQEELVVVGTRRVRGYHARPHVLYGLPSVEQRGVRQVVDPEVPRPRKSRTDSRYPQGRDADLLVRAVGQFGSSSFTVKDFAEATGLQQNYAKHRLYRLRELGHLLVCGVRPNGGMPAKLYRVSATSSPGVNIHTAEATA